MRKSNCRQEFKESIIKFLLILAVNLSLHCKINSENLLVTKCIFSNLTKKYVKLRNTISVFKSIRIIK